MTTKGNQYPLTVILMLTTYVICVPLTDQSADTVVSAYIRDVFCWFGGCRKSYLVVEVSLKFIILDVATQLGR